MKTRAQKQQDLDELTERFKAATTQRTAARGLMRSTCTPSQLRAPWITRARPRSMAE